MPLALGKDAADLSAQVDELRRLISSTTDTERRASLAEQLRGLMTELEDDVSQGLNKPTERRTSYRPISAKPRSTLGTVSEETNPSHMNDEPFSVLVAEVLGSSFAMDHPPSNILHSSTSSFWLTTGLFPQFLRLELRQPSAVESIDVHCECIKNVQLRISPSLSTPTTHHSFHTLSQDTTVLPIHTTVATIDLCILSGSHPFIKIYSINLNIMS